MTRSVVTLMISPSGEPFGGGVLCLLPLFITNIGRQTVGQATQQLTCTPKPEAITDEERAIVLNSFPEVEIQGKEAALTIDFEKITYGNQWPEPVRYSEITELNLNEGTLYIKFAREKKQSHSIKMKVFDKRQQEVLDTLNRYYGRYVAARTYQQHKAALAASSAQQTAPHSAL